MTEIRGNNQFGEIETDHRYNEDDPRHRFRCASNLTSEEIYDRRFEYFNPTPLPDYACPACGKRDTSTGTQKIDEFPIILRMGVNRYKFRHLLAPPGAAGGEQIIGAVAEKVTTLIRIDNTLDLLPYATQAERERMQNRERSKYTLVSILRHRGRTANSGHYMADCRINTTGEEEGEQWYHFDDVKDNPGMISEPGPGSGYPLDPSANEEALTLFYVRNDKLGQPQNHRRTDICNLENLWVSCYMSAVLQCLFSLF